MTTTTTSATTSTSTCTYRNKPECARWSRFAFVFGLVLIQPILFKGKDFLEYTGYTTRFNTPPQVSRNRSIAVDKELAQDQTQQERAASLTSTSSTSTTSTTSSSRPLALKVPFYIYESKRLNWVNATFGFSDKYETYKHSDDLWLLRGAMRHPLRTRNPKDAKLFFVPTLLNLAASLNPTYGRLEFCVSVATATTTANNNNNTNETTLCFHHNGADGDGDPSGDHRRHYYDAFKFADTELGQQPWFQRNNGRDHVIVMAHYSSLDKLFYNGKTNKPPRLKNLTNCNIIDFEGLIPPALDRYTLPKLYTGKFCNNINHGSSNYNTTATTRQKTHDFAMIATLKNNQPTFRTRSNICRWLSYNNNNNDDVDDNDNSMQQPQQQSSSKNYSVSVCGPGDQCPALPNSKYGFHVRGDTLGSNRLLDTLLSRTVPIFTNRDQYTILPPDSIAPWHNMSYLISVKSRESFQAAIDKLLSKPPGQYQTKLKLIEEYMPIFDHRTIYRFDAYMAEFAKLQGFQ